MKENDLAKSIFDKIYVTFLKEKIPKEIAQISILNYNEKTNFLVIDTKTLSIGFFPTPYDYLIVRPLLREEDCFSIKTDEIKIDVYNTKTAPYINIDIHLYYKGLEITTIHI